MSNGNTYPESPLQTLNGMANNTDCRIIQIHGGGAMKRRLMDLGLIPGAKITFLRTAPLNDPIEIRVGNSFISLRREEAEKIEVSP